MYAHTYVSMYVQCVHTWHSLQHSTTQHNTTQHTRLVQEYQCCHGYSVPHSCSRHQHTHSLSVLSGVSVHPTPPPYITPHHATHPTPAVVLMPIEIGGGNQQWFYVLVTRKADTDVSAATCCYVAGCLVYAKGPHKLKMNISSIASMWNMYIRYSIHSIH